MCMCVCVWHIGELAKTAEPIQMSVGEQTAVYFYDVHRVPENVHVVFLSKISQPATGLWPLYRLTCVSRHL